MIFDQAYSKDDKNLDHFSDLALKEDNYSEIKKQQTAQSARQCSENSLLQQMKKGSCKLDRMTDVHAHAMTKDFS